MRHTECYLIVIERSVKANQILNEAGCSLIFTPNEYYAGSRTALFIECQNVAEGHNHGGGMEPRNSGDRVQIQSLASLHLERMMLY